MSEQQRLALTIGRMPSDDTWWLCISDMDGSDISMVAQFQSEDHMHFFSEFMKTQGYASLPLPTNSEIDRLLDE